MTTRNYNQACSVARFFDVLGSRWTLLIVRDLLARPRQFKELLDSAPSMGPNLLTRRLKELGEKEIVEKVKNEGGPVRYQLTGKGRGLEPIIAEIIRWSLRHIAIDPDDPGVGRPDLLLVVLRALFQADQALAIDETYQLEVDGEIINLHVRNGELRSGIGRAEEPRFILKTSSSVLDQIGTGALDIEAALGNGHAMLEGDEEAFTRFVQIFTPPAPV